MNALFDLIEGKATLAQVEASLPRLKHFVPEKELRTMWHNCHGEEGEFFIQKLLDLDTQILRMPQTYENREGDPLCVLHYFYRGCDWYIIERDKGSEDDENPGEQHQAWGYACLNGDFYNAETGYISLPELFSVGAVELDLYFTPKPLSEIRKQR